MSNAERAEETALAAAADLGDSGILLDESLQLRVRVCRTPADYELAWRIRHCAWRQEDNGGQTHDRRRYSLHDAWPGTVTLLFSLGPETLCTLTVHEDSSCGLPADGHFVGHLDGLRYQGERLAEMSIDCLPSFRFFMLMTVVPHLVRAARVAAFSVGQATRLVSVQPQAVAGVLRRYGGFVPLVQAEANGMSPSDRPVLLCFDPVTAAATDARETAFFTRRQALSAAGNDTLATALKTQHCPLLPADINRYFLHGRSLLPTAPRAFVQDLAVALAARCGLTPAAVRCQFFAALPAPRAAGALLAWLRS